DLKGKPYLQVAHRLVWFREDHPKGRIQTEIVTLAEDKATVKAAVVDEAGNLLSVAHKTEYESNFGDFLEKAETGAIGRALAIAGYGTQFDPEMDEEDRLADSPVEPAKKAKVAKSEAAPAAEEKATDLKEEPEKKKPGRPKSSKPKYANRDELQKLIQGTVKIVLDRKALDEDDEVAKAKLKEKVKALDKNANASKDLEMKEAEQFYAYVLSLVEKE